MQVTFNTMNLNNRYNNLQQSRPQQSFTSTMKVAQDVGSQAVRSKLFNPFKKAYAGLVDGIRENYHKKIIGSKFMSWFLDKTEKHGLMDNMPTHLMVAGSTLISGMYAIRTLQNKNLDEKKRKTLAINDVLVWGVSTALTYLTDKGVGKWWEGVTRKYTAAYIQKYTDPEFLKSFNEAEKAKKLAKGKDYVPPKADYNVLAEHCKELGLTGENLNKKILEAADDIVAKNAVIDHKNNLFSANNSKLAKGAKPAELLDRLPEIKNIKDYNVNVLKFQPLTNKLKGYSLLKTVFIVGMMYRYIVPVLVMKPANKLGAYIHKKNEEKELAAQVQQAKKV